MSGYCRSTVLVILIMLALCVTAASAATLSNSLIVGKVTQTFEIVTTTAPASATCPTGCSCMMESAAKDKFQGIYHQCGTDPCSVAVTGAAQLKAYCFGPGTPTTTPTCPTGCVCITDAMAKQRYGDYSRCDPAGNPCGYEQDQTPKYCIKQGSATPTCPEGCSCISDATAKTQGGTWNHCKSGQDDVPCGYEQSTATLAAVIQVPKYCQKQQETTPVCPDGCTCISDADAKLKGLTTKCDPNENPCGYQSITATANIQANRIPLYCYKTDITTITPTPICPNNCGGCMNEVDAKAKYGPFNYTRCSDNVCGYDQTATSSYALPKYCFGPTVTVTPTPQVCPEGCYCVQEAEAKAKFGSGNYARCDPNGQPCGYDQSAASANGIPKYCFKPLVTPTPSVCPEGCSCITNTTAVEKGMVMFCGGKLASCGYDANKQPLFCYTDNPDKACPAGCTCISNATGVERGLSFCGGVVTRCGWDNKNQVALHCFATTPTPSCTYDYQKNACTGTCQQGYTCGLLASEKDATGKVTYGVCGCTGQPATPCAFDAQKNACTGTCPSGAACAIVGRNVDEKTGAATPVCGCPQQSSCSYNYDKEACVGTCPVTGDNCQLNTIYRDQTTGKVTYAECHCKGAGDTCSCDASTGACSGTCADGKACTMTERTTDNAGKVVCKSCGCADTCVLNADNQCSGTCATGAPCTRTVTKDDSGQEKVSCVCGGSQPGTPVGVAPAPQGIFEAIGSFFSRLFGGK